MRVKLLETKEILFATILRPVLLMATTCTSKLSTIYNTQLPTVILKLGFNTSDLNIKAMVKAHSL